MNNNNSEVSGKLSVYTLTTGPMLGCEQQSKHDCKEAKKMTLSKQGHAEDIPKDDFVNVVLHKEWTLKIGRSSITDVNRGTCKMTERPEVLINAKEPVKSSVFEKWEMMDRDGQRTLAQCQLSEDSKKSCTFRLMKKTTMKKEEEPRKDLKMPSTHSGKLRDSRDNKSTLNEPSSRRILPKDLIPNPEVFSKVDAQAINVGRELGSKEIFSVTAITQAITDGVSSDLEKLRAIWIWLCHNIEYDVTGYLGLTEKICCPEQVIVTGRGVCCGYSSVCLQMCREAGIECREVSGHGKGIGYQQGQSYQNTKSSHMWNAVCLEGHWYLLDACWGAGRVDLDNRAFIKRYEEFYFLTDPENFINSHFPDEEEWQLLESPIQLEEFEKRVLKTSDFYRLNLTLIYPKHFLLVTENDEATVLMGFPQPVDFTYQISQRSGSEQQQLSNSTGLMSTTQSTMKLRLMPLNSGTYDIMVFACPGNTSRTFSWVCSFQLKCLAPKISEELPENPYLTWGLQQDAMSVGLKPCKYGNDIILLESGSFELHLKTTRPLMMLCELSHKDLDKTLAEKCLAIQTEPDQLTCNILCPYLGYYRLSVFVREWENAADSFQNAGNFLLHCTGCPVNLNELFPHGLISSCGPGTRALEAGLTRFSHAEALVYTQQGKCNITFQNHQDLDLHGVLTKEKYNQPENPLLNHVFFTYNGSNVTVSISLPECGVYKLGLYGKTSFKQEFSLLCDYILKNTSMNKWSPFPCTYKAWKKGSVLFEPRTGMLEPFSWVRFRLRVPGTRKVSVQGEQRVDLQLSKSRVWEGEVFTGRGPQLKLAASQSETSNEMAILLSFSVLDPKNQI
ncbi:kyphoscoliosis peptidase-like [Myxocyprinus asiaticus]|uniref:kyphoscoliosis peptidase-like n=1 Tax=Myxocyprinus asiaticus TaxID=70543 RepID=UPI002221C3C6|nr:kyphoscoliosis peptidase-like [Myxocyprinus asiaticus]XP_051514907.1 kyphoscoliosis peptidase-like [Myxocyprinus asiaticus]